MFLYSVGRPIRRVAVVCFFGAVAAFAQDSEVSRLPVDSTPRRTPSWLVIPGFFSFPETGPGVALKARVRDAFGVPGFVDATVAGTWKRQLSVSAQVRRDSIGGRWRFDEVVEGGVFPNKWYGRGNPSPDSLEGGYDPTYISTTTRLARLLEGGWAVEGALRLEGQDIETDREGAFLLQPTRDPHGGFYVGMGGALEHDGRDLPENPRHGDFLRLEVRSTLPGSESLWGQLQTDASWASAAGPLVAVVRVRTVDAWGDIPFWELPRLGFREALRGLPDSRLRGEAVQCAGLELRWTLPRIWKTTWQVGAFVEEGRAGDHRSVWTATPTAAAGGGLRLLLDGGRAIVRLDYGFSEVGDGVYLDFGQAF